jgi:hypothetical protein
MSKSILFLIFVFCALPAAAFNLDMMTKRGISFVDLQSQKVLAPTSHDFGSQNTGTNTDYAFTLSNPGNDVLEAATLTVTGTGYSLLSTDCGSNPFDLALLTSCTATVRFTPGSAGVLTGSLTAAAPNMTDTVASLTGTGVGTDSTPTAFTFNDETDIALSTAKVSNTITVAGIDTTANITVSGDTGYGYKKNGAACTASAGTVVVNDTVNACVTSSGSNSTATAASVTIGGVSDTYTVTTIAAGPVVLAGDNTDYSGANGVNFDPSANIIYFHSFTALASGTVTNGYTYSRGGPTPTCKMVVANSSLAVLEESSPLTYSATTGNKKFTFAGTTTLTQGVTYNLGWYCGGSQWSRRISTGATSMPQMTGVTYPTVPGTLVISTSTSVYPATMYLTHE